METHGSPVGDLQCGRRNLDDVDGPCQHAQKAVPDTQPGKIDVEGQVKLPGTRIAVRVEAVDVAIGAIAVQVGFPFVTLPGEQVIGPHANGQIEPAGQPGSAPGQK